MPVPYLLSSSTRLLPHFLSSNIKTSTSSFGIRFNLKPSSLSCYPFDTTNGLLRNSQRFSLTRQKCCYFENTFSVTRSPCLSFLKNNTLPFFQPFNKTKQKNSLNFHRNVVYFLRNKRNSRRRRKRNGSPESSNLENDEHSNKNKWKEFILGAQSNEASWNIPWEPFTIFQVMFLWFISFTIVGSYVMPSILSFLQISHASLSYRHQAIYSLITDTCELFVGIGIINRCLASFQPLPKELFYFNWKGFWLFEIMTAVTAFPLVCVLSKVNLFLLPVKMNLNAKVPIEQNLNLNDPVATLLYSIVVIVCAPVWEEIIFRGFLLPSLTKYLPVSSSLVISSACFALAHFSVQRFLPLFFLGIVIGSVYLRSRNLFSSMLLHGMWNGYVFIQLLR